MSTLPKPMLRYKYQKAAEKYLAGLTLENFAEATAQATQRKITLESLDLVNADRPDVHVYNELLVQYPKGAQGEQIGQIVPDNMVVISDQPPDVDTSYDLPIVRVRPFWVLEYVSKHNHRKDYEISLAKYEQELKVPYYLVFYPEAQEMTLFKLAKSRYGSVRANRNERYPIRELDLEVALLDSWVRYWYKGDLLPLPADLQRDLNATRRQLKQEQKARAAAEAEVVRLRAELERLRKNHR